MNNLKVEFKKLERNPIADNFNDLTVAKYIEKICIGYVQGYTHGHDTIAIVLHETELLQIPLNKVKVVE